MSVYAISATATKDGNTRTVPGILSAKSDADAKIKVYDKLGIDFPISKGWIHSAIIKEVSKDSLLTLLQQA